MSAVRRGSVVRTLDFGEEDLALRVGLGEVDLLHRAVLERVQADLDALRSHDVSSGVEEAGGVNESAELEWFAE